MADKESNIVKSLDKIADNLVAIDNTIKEAKKSKNKVTEEIDILSLVHSIDKEADLFKTYERLKVVFLLSLLVFLLL